MAELKHAVTSPPSRSASRDPLAPTESPDARGVVLVIKQACVLREIESAQLRDAHYQVVTCENAHAAVLEASKRPFDAIVLRSESASGDLESIRGLRRLLPLVHILFLTAGLKPEVARELAEIGHIIVVSLPATPRAIVERVNQVVGGSGITRAAAATSLGSHASPVPAPASTHVACRVAESSEVRFSRPGISWPPVAVWAR